jgi:hypothetical protein
LYLKTGPGRCQTCAETRHPRQQILSAGNSVVLTEISDLPSRMQQNVSVYYEDRPESKDRLVIKTNKGITFKKELF